MILNIKLEINIEKKWFWHSKIKSLTCLCMTRIIWLFFIRINFQIFIYTIIMELLNIPKLRNPQKGTKIFVCKCNLPKNPLKKEFSRICNVLPCGIGYFVYIIQIFKIWTTILIIKSRNQGDHYVKFCAKKFCFCCN